MSFRIVSLMVWGMASATVMFWMLRLGINAPPAPAYAVVEPSDRLASEDLSRLLGAEASSSEPGPSSSPPPEAARFQLVGLVAGLTPESASALALIAIDGKPAKPYAVGARIGGTWVVQSVSRRSVALGPEGSQAPGVMLEIPALPPASTGNLEPATMSPDPAQPKNKR
jgi:general secretion pathway protein C